MTAIHFDGSRESWHRIRERFIGGSEVASLFHTWLTADGAEEVFHTFQQPPGGLPLASISPYKTGFRLWQEKREGLAAENLDDVERIQAGTFLEPAIAEWSKAKFGWRIRKVHRYLQHDDVHGWGSSLDYELHETGCSGAPVEIKNVDFLAFRDGWEVDDGDAIVSLPLHILLQVQAQIGVAGADHGWVVANVGGNKLYRGRVDRHDGVQAMLTEAISEFWASLTRPDWLASADVAKEVWRIGQKDKAADLSGDNEAPVLAARLMRWKRHLDLTEAVIDGIKGRLQMKMGDATKATLPGFSITWPAIHREAKVIPAREQSELDYRGGFTVRVAKPTKEKVKK